MAKYGSDLEWLAQVGMAMSDPGRLRLLMALEDRSLCVCQLTELLGLAPSTVSKHLSVLKQTGLVRENKRGRWVYHELCSGECPCYPVQSWIRQQLADDHQIAQDRARLQQILQHVGEEEPCCK